MIKTGKLGSNYAKIVASAQDDRFRADYDVIYSADRKEVKENIKIAKDFLDVIKNYLEKKI